MEDNMMLTFIGMPGQCPMPEGETTLCENPGTVIYHTEEANNTSGFMWVLSPEEAGTVEVNEMEAHVTWNENFTGTAQLMVAGMNMCGEGEMSEPLEITVMSTPQQATVPVGETEVCESASAIQYSVDAVAFADNYFWQLQPEEAGTITANGTQAEITFNELWSGTAVLMVMGANECGEGEQSAPLEITVAPMPTTPALPTGATEICEGSTDVMYQTDGATVADDYVWEIIPAEAAAISPSGSQATFSFNEGFNGEAQIHVMAINDCGSSNFSEAITINLAPKPAQPAAVTGDVEACQGVTKSFNVAEIDHAETVEWTIEPAEAGTLSQNGMDCEILFSETWTGDAIIKVRGINDCGDGQWSEDFVISLQDCTGVEEIQSASLSVFPNPNQGSFSVTLEAHDTVDMHLVNTIGETVYSKTDISVNGMLQTSIEVSEIANGIYYLMISGQKTNAIQKIVINK
jgi:hypothetical protein